jgi:aerobic C4-dicarboxylate transport protein
MTGTTTEKRPKFVRTLYFRVLVGIAAGLIVGYFWPQFGRQMKPLGDGFIKLIRMIICPLIFFTVVVGIAGIGDMRKLGRVGIKALLYFEVVTTLALGIGLLVVKIVQPGAGINANPATLDASAIKQYASQGHELNAVDFLLNIIPDTVVGAFAKGEILQVLLLAILFGLALASWRPGIVLVEACDKIAHALFRVVALIMEAAPLGAFGAMAFTIGEFGADVLAHIGKVLACVYLTSAGFVFGVLGLIAFLHGFSLWKFLKYIKGELLIALSTSSSESVLPRMLEKLEKLGCSKTVVGLVVPAGYSFNLDGTSVYLTIAALFVAQATNTHLTTGQEIALLLILVLSSKGAAAVTGGGFITLAATLSALGTIPVAGLTLLLGIDRFMSEMRTMVNLIGNGVATIVVAKWEGEFDAERARRLLNGENIVETPAAGTVTEEV